MAGSSATPMQTNGAANPPALNRSPPIVGPTMYPSPVEISVMPRLNETASGSMSAIRAYAAVSSSAEPKPCTQRSTKHQQKYAGRELIWSAIANAIVPPATMARPAIYTCRLPWRESWPATGDTRARGRARAAV